MDERFWLISPRSLFQPFVIFPSEGMNSVQRLNCFTRLIIIISLILLCLCYCNWWLFLIIGLIIVIILYQTITVQHYQPLSTFSLNNKSGFTCCGPHNSSFISLNTIFSTSVPTNQVPINSSPNNFLQSNEYVYLSPDRNFYIPSNNYSIIPPTAYQISPNLTKYGSKSRPKNKHSSRKLSHISHKSPHSSHKSTDLLDLSDFYSDLPSHSLNPKYSNDKNIHNQFTYNDSQHYNSVNNKSYSLPYLDKKH